MIRTLPLPSRVPPHPTAHSLLVLSEYALTLDSLPLDLSRHFGDLRELDAVLSASTATTTQKIYELVDLIEDPAASKDARLAKLGEVVDEAQRLKLGSEDKIRVASQAAENLASHQSHLGNLLNAIVAYDTSFTPSHLYQRTTYPHIPPRPAQDAVPLEGNRRRRAGAGRGQLGGMLAVEALSPVKSRKRVREEEDSQPTPRRERESNNTNAPKRSSGGGGGGSGGSKTRRAETHSHLPARVHRADSPAESVVSITTTMPPYRVASDVRAPAPPAPPAPQAAPRGTQQQQQNAATPVAPPTDGDEGGDEGEHDGGRYCYCQGPSYGEMVGCDDEHCAFEWFHLTCIGLTSAPKGGTWYCDDCKVKRAGNRKGRSGKRRTGGSTNTPSGGGARAGRGRT